MGELSGSMFNPNGMNAFVALAAIFKLVALLVLAIVLVVFGAFRAVGMLVSGVARLVSSGRGASIPREVVGGGEQGQTDFEEARLDPRLRGEH